MTDSNWKAYEDYLVRTRYSVRDPETGKPLESTFDQLLEGRVLPALAGAGVPEEVLAAIRAREIMPATPLLMSLGNPHTRRPGYFSCFPLGRVDDSLSGIDVMKAKMRQIYTYGGGVGIDVSGLRAKGAPVDNGQGTSSGPVAFLQDFDAVTGTTNQGGRRRGALLVQMDWEHPDIREFVRAKNFNGVMSRLVRTLPESERPPQTGTLTNMNLSVNVYGKFWEDDELIDLIARNMWATGDPGLLFIDNMLEHSPIRAEDEPRYSNPCGEYLSSAMTACNLITVNVAALARNAGTGYRNSFLAGVARAARDACILGNAILEIDAGYPLEEIREKTIAMRPVGVGMSGFHSALLIMFAGRARYGSSDSRIFAVRTQAALTLGTLNASMKLGEAAGNKVYKNREYWTKHLHELRQTLNSCFNFNEFIEIDKLESYVANHGGFCNCVTTSQPPTGSVSAFLRNLDTGIEPFYSASVERRVRTPEGGWETFVLEADPDVKKYLADSDAHPAAHDIPADEQLEMLGAFQRHCHTGISKTVNLPASATVEDVKRLILKARDLRLKGFTVYRDGSLDQVITAHSPKDDSPAGAHTHADAPMDAGARAYEPPRVLAQTRPPAHADALAQVPADAHACADAPAHVRAGAHTDAPAHAGDGERQAAVFKARSHSLNAHVTLAHDADNNIREVFVAAGEMGADVNAIYTAFGMILSVALRHDPALFGPLVKVLCKVNMSQRVVVKTSMSPEPVVGSSLPQAIGLLMSQRKDFLDRGEPVPVPHEPGNFDLCPECHGLTLRREGSCRKCLGCGYSSC
ncbi:MAG: hypothetical protein LBQ79_07765 [Deltaproteobacteria bacterium]|jgi:ribonucleoside-diphosphate reductase alpha chain|nr:hypothetical protein [Deltaproteobacteria bacterium]